MLPDHPIDLCSTSPPPPCILYYDCVTMHTASNQKLLASQPGMPWEQSQSKHVYFIPYVFLFGYTVMHTICDYYTVHTLIALQIYILCSLNQTGTPWHCEAMARNHEEQSMKLKNFVDGSCGFCWHGEKGRGGYNQTVPKQSCDSCRGLYGLSISTSETLAKHDPNQLASFPGPKRRASGLGTRLDINILIIVCVKGSVMTGQVEPFLATKNWSVGRPIFSESV